MSPFLGSPSSYPKKGNSYLCIFPLCFILYPFQLYQNACHWVTDTYKRCKKPIQEGSQFQFETSNPEYNFSKKAGVIEQVLKLLNAIRKGGNEDDVRSVLGIVSTFLEWHFPKNSRSTVGNIAKLAKHQWGTENNETFAKYSSKDDETITDNEKKLGYEKNTVLLGESGKITEREPKKIASSPYIASLEVTSKPLLYAQDQPSSDRKLFFKRAVETTSTCSDLSIGCGVKKKITDPAEPPDFLGLSGEDKNVQKNGVQVESAEKGENSTPAGNVTPSFTSNGRMGNGGSDGDGDGDDEPHIRDSNLPNGHYEESLVPQHVQGTSINHRPLSPEENDTDLHHDPLLSTHDNGLNNVVSRSDHNERRGQSEEVDGEELIDVDGEQPRNVSVAHDVNPTISNTSTAPHLQCSPYDLDSSGQACYISTNLASGSQAQTFKENLPSQKILSQLNKEVLAVKNDGTYREHVNFISCDFAGAGRFGRCDFCQDKKTGASFVRKTMTRNEFVENEINLWRALNNSPGLNRNILTFFGALQENEHVSMFMECMSGSLAHIANMQLSWSEKEIIVIFKQVLQGLCFIHEKGIIHRDVKCENLFYNSNTFDIKIGDYGLCFPLDGELVVKNGKLCGTVQGMAYEVCAGLPYGRSSDMWSFACAVIHLITGHMAWPNCNTAQIIYQVGSGSIPKLPTETECSREFNQMLSNLFSKNPAQRPTANQLLHDNIFTSMSEAEFEEELAGVFGRILEHQYSSYDEPSNESDLSASGMEEIIGGSSPMSLSGPDHEISYDAPQEDSANLVNEGGLNMMEED